MADKKMGPPEVLAEGTERSRGRDAMRMNIMAARAIADMLRTTLGPMGMDKMLVDSLGDVIVTNDGATIMREMDVGHPIARMMIEVAKSQESSVGDGTTTVVVLAGELLKAAEGLIEMGVHPVVVARGYRVAARECQRILDSIAIPSEGDDDVLKSVAMTTMTGKGPEQAKEHLADIIVKAFRTIATKEDGRLHVDVDFIKLEKREGAPVEQTQFIEGLVLAKEKASIAMPDKVQDAKIALLSIPLEFKGKSIDAKINIMDPEQLKSFFSEEKNALREMVVKIKASGATVVFNERTVDNQCLPIFNREGILVIRTVRRDDMEKLSRATGAVVVTNLDDLTPELLGYAGVVEQKNVDGKLMIFARHCQHPKAVSILIRGGTSHITGEVERALEDCMGTLPAVLEDGKILVGGGSAEIELAKRLRGFASTVGGLERLAVEAFSNALEIVPKSLAENAGLNPLDVLVEMRSQNEKNGLHMGLDVINGKVRDLYKEKVLEPVRVKKQAIGSASELAFMILRIDDNIAAKKIELPSARDVAGVTMGKMK